MRIGILGGTFNPPHRGHLALARTVLDLALADSVALIPAALPPHKAKPVEVDPATRLAMTRLLAESDARLRVDDIELRRDGPSFTIDTVRELSASNPGDTYRLIIGSDLAKTFATWRSFRELLELAPPLVAERPDWQFAHDAAADFPGMSDRERNVVLQGRFPMRHLHVNSTLVRELIENGADDNALAAYLTEPVLAFIRSRRLYADWD